MSDWNEIRRQYPLTHKRTYLKSASIGGMHQKVLEETIAWERSIANDAGVNEGRFGEIVLASRDRLAEFLHCPAEQVTITENTSHNMNMAAMMLKQRFPEGLEIIAPADEFPSSILPFYHHGIEVKQVPSHQGVFEVEDILNSIGPKTKAVVCSHVQFSTGLRTDIEALSRALESRGLEFIVNATQSLGVFPFDLRKLKVSMLTATCHKWMGAGMGRAILYMSEDFMKNHRPPILGWCSVYEPFEMKNIPKEPRTDVATFQLGTLPFAHLAAVKRAIEINMEIGPEKIRERVLDLSQKLRFAIRELDLEILGSDERERCSGITTFAITKPADELITYLEERSIYVNNRRGLIRAAIHFYNNEDDIDAFINALKDFLKS